jgi:hypothetical protein
MIKSIFFSLLFILLLSCKRVTPVEQRINDSRNESIELGMFKSVNQGETNFLLSDIRKKYKFISLVYLKNDCAPCYDSFIEWHKKMEGSSQKFNYTIIFIIRGKSYEDFISEVHKIEPLQDKFYSIMDPNMLLLEGNKNIPEWIFDLSLLIDENNRIRVIGEPFRSPKLFLQFETTCSEQ